MNLKREYYQRPRTSDKNIATIKNVVKFCLMIYQISKNSQNKRHSIITNQGHGLSIVMLLSNLEQGYGSAGDINKVVKSTEPKIIRIAIRNKTK